MSIQIRVPAVTFVFMVFSSIVCSAEPTPDSIAKAIRDQSAHFEKQAIAIEAAYLFQVFSSNGVLSQSDYIEYSQLAGQCVVVVKKQNSINEPGTLNYASAVNDKYGFFLRRQNDEWLLTELTAPPSRQDRLFDDMQRPYALAGLRSSYRQLLESASTRLVSAQKVEWHGNPRYELIFDTTMPTAHEGKPMKRRYGFFVHPEHLGVVCGTRIYDPADHTKWLHEEMIEYQFSANSLPKLKTVDIYVTDKTSGYKPWRAQHLEIAEYRGSQTPLPGRMFTLTAFGLPEPKAIPKATTVNLTPPSRNINLIPVTELPPETSGHLWYWIGLGLIVIALLALYARYRYLRNRSGAI